jgi:PAS domain S-box-containing protein
LENKTCAELQTQLEQAQKEIAYYRRLSKEAGNLRLRETEDLSGLIAKLKHTEKEIIREKDKLKTLSDNAPFGMVLIDKEDHFTYINRKFTELFGYDLSDVPDGRTWCRMAYPDVEYRHTIISTWKEDMQDTKPGERLPRAFTIVCKDGTQKIARLIISILISGDYLMTCEDITELKRLESQLRQGQKMEAIGTLAGGIAHDFNNILTALMGYASLIQIKMDRSDPLRSYVDAVLLASEKAADLTQSLLAFSRQQSVTLVPLDMNNTIKETKKLLRRLLTEDIEFHTALADDDMIVMADKSQMDQILFNLVTNARDAMPKEGTLTIETAIATIDSTFIKVHGFGEQGRYVRISITDTGEGMDEITRSKIFDPFFTTKEVGKGTGLGLATVYGIVKQHNGYITVESALNQGSVFHVYLPHVRGEVDKMEDKIIPIKRGKETILIAEGNEGVRRFMREALQGHGYIITEAIDGEDAVRKFKENRDIHLIIIDSVMPKKNGREAYEEIHGINPHIKALFTSGYTKDIVLNKGLVEKEFDFIAKPLSLDKLLQKVREVLDK